MHHSQQHLALFPLDSRLSSPDHTPIASSTQGLPKVTPYTASLTPGSEKKMLYQGRTAMCVGALPSNTAGQDLGSWVKVLHKQSRVSGDAESLGTGTMEMQLIKCKTCSPGWTEKIPSLSPSPAHKSKALPRRHDVHPGCLPQHYSSTLERNKPKSAPPASSQHMTEVTPPLDEVLRKAEGSTGTRSPGRLVRTGEPHATQERARSGRSCLSTGPL